LALITINKPCGFSSRLKTLVFSLLLITLFFSCSKEIEIQTSKQTSSYDAEFILGYYDLLCSTIRKTPGYFPPQASRAYGYIGIAQYEAVVHGIDGQYSLSGQLTQLEPSMIPKPAEGLEYNWAIASNAATAQMFRRLFEKRMMAEDKAIIDQYEDKIHKELSAAVEFSIVERSKAFGITIAEVIFEYSKTDGGHEAYLDPFQQPYTVPSDPYCWVPTGAIKTPLSPLWGSNRPFLTDNISRTKVAAHVPFSEVKGSEFYQQALVVYTQAKENTTEHKEIAKYWADDPFQTCTPAGHSFNILSQLLRKEKANLAEASVAYAMMGVAENDAFIACWKGKYEYLLIRPVSYIQRYIDPAFTTFLNTPPFPAYTSGHSTEIGAASRILIDRFSRSSGYYPFTDYSQLQYGLLARSFSNFDQMANECALSRLYGGIHYPMDNEKGLQLGRAIGDNVLTEIHWPPL
jgi:hypothetical protein